MRRLGVLSLLVAALMTLTMATATAQSGPTLRQLQRALVTEDDLWETDAISGIWSEDDADVLDSSYPAVYVDFYEALSDDFFSVELHDARNGSPFSIAVGWLNYREDKYDIVDRWQARPTGYGTDGVRYQYIRVEHGTRWYGDLAVWQQGQVVVAVLLETWDPDECVCAFAALQCDKVAVTIR